MKIDRQKATLLPIRGDSLVRGHQIAVSAALFPAPALGILQTEHGRCAPVRAVPIQARGAPVVVVAEALWDELDLAERDGWTVTLGEHRAITASRIALERAADERGEGRDRIDQATLVQRHLGGAVLWHPPNAGDAQDLDLGGTLYQVRALEPTAPGSLYTFDATTRVQLVTSSARVGIDIVILADCSGSMSVNDLDEGPAEGAHRLMSRPIQRIEAVRRALKRLVELRKATSGRTSKIALLAFNQQTRQLFPVQGGMADFDASAAPALIGQFESAIGLLTPDGGTDIGQALTAAQNLLVKFGQPGNERLIVLLSDGADLPQREQGEGEIIEDFKDPVTVMTRLHSWTAIRLHAIGISTPEIFARWARERKKDPDSPGYCPNHELLHALMKVGGGDPTRMGDTDVLRSYFADLGYGAYHDIAGPSAWTAPPLSTGELASIEEALGHTEAKGRREDPALQKLVYALAGARTRCNDAAVRRVGRRLFAHLESANLTSLLGGLHAAAQTEAGFRDWIAVLYQVFFEGRDGRTASGAIPPYEMPEVQRILAEEDFHDITLFHAAYADPSEDGVERSRLSAAVQGAWRRRVGGAAPAWDATPAWYDLQVSLLRGLSATLTRVEDAFRRAPVDPPSTAVPALEVIPRQRPLSLDERNRLFDRIIKLSDTQLDELAFRVGAPEEHLPGKRAPSAERGMALIRICEQDGKTITALQVELQRLVAGRR